MPENPKSPRDQFLDDLLDASLREYGRTDPRIGLENRVLRRLEEAPPKSLWLTGWHWSAVGVVATMIVVAMALISYPPESRVGPGAAPGNTTPAATAPPANRSPRFNQTIPASGIRPDLGRGDQTKTLPPCKPAEELNAAATKPAPKVPESTKSNTKVSEDCVPVSTRQQPPRRDPQK